jgi:hypothetical protein
VRKIKVGYRFSLQTKRRLERIQAAFPGRYRTVTAVIEAAIRRLHRRLFPPGRGDAA